MKSRFTLLIVTCSALALAASFAAAQSTTVDHLTQPQLLEKSQALVAKAQAQGGNASSKLAEYPNHYTMIALRNQNGGAEIHDNFADIFLVLQGSATLVSGGTVPDAKRAGEGEQRGAAVEGGARETLNQGDVVHIPAGVPHQLLLSSGGTFVYFVVKVKEK